VPVFAKLGVLGVASTMNAVAARESVTVGAAPYFRGEGV
jgi:hypothetical protein